MYPAQLSLIVVQLTSVRAKMGVPCRTSTLDHSRDKGRALSRANAQVHREAATVMEIEQNSVITRTRNVRPRPPPGESMTTPKMYGRACPTGAAKMSSKGGRVAQMGMMKNRPAIPPTGTHREMALGSLVVGSPHSSAIEVIMPRAEKLQICKDSFQGEVFAVEYTHVYAAGSMPIKKENPPQPDREVS